MSRPHHASRVLGLLALSVLVAPTGAEAQFRLVPQVGLYAATAEFPPPESAVEFGKRESSLAFGLALELGGIRLSGLHATESEVPIDGLGCTECARSTVTTATLALVIRPLPSLGVAEPFVVLGGGVKRYDFTREDLGDEGTEAVLSDSNDLTAHFGVGLDLGLGGIRGRLEVQDLMSRFDAEGIEPEFQHDLFFTVGLVLGGG